MADTNSAAPKKISVFKLVMLTAAIIVSVRNLPMMAEVKLQMLFFVFIAVVMFLIPTALVSAELATGWPEQGGVYVWVKEAFGERWGFLATWLQWIQMPFGMVMILSFVAGSLAFVFNPGMKNNGLFIFVIVAVVYWGATLLNLRGMNTSSMISTVCLLAGVLIPAVLIIIFGLIYWIGGNPLQVNFAFSAGNYFPPMDIHHIALLAGFIFTFSGIEVSAAHANEVENPQRNYPIAILLSVIIIVTVNVLGGLFVAMVVPHSQLTLNAGIMQAFQSFFNKFHVSWLIPVCALLTGLGAIGQVSTWIVGPVKGLLSTAQNGDLPRVFQKVNKNGVPTNLLIVQASLVTVIGLLFAFIPSVNTSFLMVLNMTILLYLVMYILMLLAALRLRYKEPDVKRPYRVPGPGNSGMWVVAGIGLLACSFTFFVAFFPPSQLKISSPTFYVAFLVVCNVVLISIPFIIYKFRKPSWAKGGECTEPGTQE